MLTASRPFPFLVIPFVLEFVVLEESWITLSTSFFCGIIPLPFDDGIIIPGKRGEMAFEVIAEAIDDGIIFKDDEPNGV